MPGDIPRAVVLLVAQLGSGCQGQLLVLPWSWSWERGGLCLQSPEARRASSPPVLGRGRRGSSQHQEGLRTMGTAAGDVTQGQQWAGSRTQWRKELSGLKKLQKEKKRKENRNQMKGPRRARLPHVRPQQGGDRGAAGEDTSSLRGGNDSSRGCGSGGRMGHGARGQEWCWWLPPDGEGVWPCGRRLWGHCGTCCTHRGWHSWGVANGASAGLWSPVTVAAFGGTGFGSPAPNMSPVRLLSARSSEGMETPQGLRARLPPGWGMSCGAGSSSRPVQPGGDPRKPWVTLLGGCSCKGSGRDGAVAAVLTRRKPPGPGRY